MLHSLLLATKDDLQQWRRKELFFTHNKKYKKLLRTFFSLVSSNRTHILCENTRSTVDFFVLVLFSRKIVQVSQRRRNKLETKPKPSRLPATLFYSLPMDFCDNFKFESVVRWWHIMIMMTTILFVSIWYTACMSSNNIATPTTTL